MTFRAAKCPNCSGDLQVPDDRDIVKCMYCGNDIIVREAIKLVLGINVDNIMHLADASVESGNYDDANKYYTKILENDVTNSKAWYGKGLCAAWQSTLANIRLSEMVTNFDKAINLTPDVEKDLMKDKVSNTITTTCISWFNIAESHYIEFADLDDALYDFAMRSLIVVESLEKAYEIKPSKVIVEWIIHISNKFNYTTLYVEYLTKYTPELQKYN